MLRSAFANLRLCKFYIGPSRAERNRQKLRERAEEQSPLSLESALFDITTLLSRGVLISREAG